MSCAAQEVHRQGARPRRSLMPGLFALAAGLLLSGCVSDAQICGSVLVLTPFSYILGLLFVHALYSAWRGGARPELRFGSTIHLVCLLLFGVLAAYGAQHARMDLGLFVLWIFGTSVVSCWLFFTWMILPGDWGFRWGGLVVNAVLSAPALGGLLDRENVETWLQIGTLAWLGTGGLGVFPLVSFILMMREARRAARDAVELGG